jgi:hypothetical protein
MVNEERERAVEGAEAEPEKETGDIHDDAEVTGADAQAESGTVEGQVPGTQSRMDKPTKDDSDSKT